MAALYHSLFTEKGLELLRESIQTGAKLGITHMSFGDGNGSLPIPDAKFTKMVKEVYRIPLNRLAPSKENANWLEADGIIPSAVGGFNIREVGLWAGNIMVAYANYPPTYKPSGDQGTAQIKTIRIVLQIDNTANFELKIDANIVMATIKAVEDAIDYANKTKIDHVDSVHKLLSADIWSGRMIQTKSYWPSLNKGGLTYIYDETIPRTQHNGGTIIDPTVVWDGTRSKWANVAGYLNDVGVGVWGVDDVSKVTNAVKDAIVSRGGNLALGSELNPTNFRTNQIKIGGFLGHSNSNENGCWVAHTTYLSPTFFGATCDAGFEIDGTDDSYALLATVRALPKKNAVLEFDSAVYTHGSADIRNIVMHFMGFDGLTIYGNNALIQSNKNNLPVSSQAIIRFDYCKNLSIYDLKTDARLDTRIEVGSDPSTNNDQHNIHVGFGCEDFNFYNCSANRAIMDGFYIYGGSEGTPEETKNITLTNCIAKYCYRQGSSLITGLNIRYVGGEYSHTGMCLDAITKLAKGTAPKRGIDIEANSAEFKDRATYIIDGVIFVGNENAGVSASNNAYGSILNSTFLKNLYINLFIEYNAKDTKVLGNTFKDASNFGIYIHSTHPIIIQNNTFFERQIAINSIASGGQFETAKTNLLISSNRFIVEDSSDIDINNSISLDTPKNATISDNYFKDTREIWIGGYDPVTIERNLFLSSRADVNKFVSTWEIGKILSLSHNIVEISSEDASISNVKNLNTEYRYNNKLNGTIEKQIIFNSNSTYSSSSNITPNNIAANSVFSIQVPIVGPGVGTPLICSYSSILKGCRLWAEITAWDTATVYIKNESNIAVEIAPGTIFLRTV